MDFDAIYILDTLQKVGIQKKTFCLFFKPVYETVFVRFLFFFETGFFFKLFSFFYQLEVGGIRFQSRRR